MATAPERDAGVRRSLVIPMLDEVGRIEKTLAAIAESSLRDGLELVLVDDGSTDGSAAVARRVVAELALPLVQIIELPVNRGKGAAVRAGMLGARGASRVFVDADLSVSIADIEGCFRALEHGHADVAYGTRAHPDSAMQRTQPWSRIIAGRTFNLLLRTLGLTAERDTQCGLKGFRAAYADAVFSALTTERFAFDVEALARARRLGARVQPCPVAWRHVEASRVRALRDGVNMTIAAVRMRRELAHDAPAAAMAEDAFDAMARVERDHWWFRAKHDLVIETLQANGLAAGTVLDVGSGTGGMLERLRKGGYDAIGAELDPHALDLAGARHGGPMVRAVAEALPCRSGAAVAVTALDVIEHLDDDVAALRELARVAGPGGLVIATVPAYAWAWSDHDVRLGHRRRYQRRSLTDAACAAGLEVVRCAHFHSWLVPVAVVVRRTPARVLVRRPAEEASYVGPRTNRVLGWASQAERAVLARRDIPAGLSVLLVARSPQATPTAPPIILTDPPATAAEPRPTVRANGHAHPAGAGPVPVGPVRGADAP
jgi:dolichyl-phosphate beta-glucosyltransferase